MKAALVEHVTASVAVIVSMGWDRLFVVLVVLAGVTWLAAADKVDAAAVIALYSATLGYVFGKAPTMGTDQRTEGEGQ